MFNSKEIKNGQEVVQNHAEKKDNNLETVKTEIENEGDAKSKETANNINEAAGIALESFSDNQELKEEINKLVVDAQNKISSSAEEFKNKLAGEAENPKKAEMLELLKSGDRDKQMDAADIFDTMQSVDNETAKAMADAHFSLVIARNLHRIEKPDAELIIKLIDDGLVDEVMLNSGFIKSHLDKNDLLDIAGKLVEDNKLDVLSREARDLFNSIDLRGNEISARVRLMENLNTSSKLEEESSSLQKQIAEMTEARKK